MAEPSSATPTRRAGRPRADVPTRGESASPSAAEGPWWRHLGPGLLLAATSIGASHILLSPEAGARFEYGLVWLVLVVHVVKYPAFEFAPRYVAARGESLLDAYARAPGPSLWAIRLGLFDMAFQALGLIAALVGLTASFVAAAFGLFSVPVWSVLLAILLLGLLALGHYTALRVINVGLLLLVAAGTTVAFAGALPPVSALGPILTPSLPDGSWLLVAAILGFMPTSVAVSIWQSLWALEQGRFRDGQALAAPERRRRLANGLLDLRIGYGLSAGLAAVFVCLGATVLHPRGLVPEGTDVALTLSRLYTEVLGSWMQPLVLLMAFAALLTTCYTMMDGFPRSFVAARRVLRGLPSTRTQAADSHDGATRASARRERTEYWIFLGIVTFGGMGLLASIPDPALLVKIVGAFGLLLSPIYFTLNLWAVTRLVDDPDLRPGLGLRALAIAGIATMIGTAGLLLWTTFGAPA